LLRHTLLHIQHSFAPQHLRLLLWFIIAFRARRAARGGCVSARVLGLPGRRKGMAAPTTYQRTTDWSLWRIQAGAPPTRYFLPLLSFRCIVAT
jgi:hypothetical protein